MSRVQASVLTLLLVAALLASPSLPVAGAVGAGATTPATDAELSDEPTVASVDGGMAPADVAASSGPLLAATDSDAIDADRVEFRITVHGNGSATWTFTYTRTLADGEERQQFEDFAAEFNANETDAYRDFRQRAAELVETGGEQTGREMAATDFAREAGLGGNCIETDRCGTVEMSFTWTEFVREDGDRLVVDDVFEGGLYLGEDQLLVMEGGPGLQFDSAAPESYTSSDPTLQDSTSITWHGERQFSDRRPRVVFVPEGQATSAAPTGTATDTSEPPDPVEGNSSTWMLLLGLLVVAIGAGLALVWRRGEGAPVIGGRGGVASEPAVAEEELLSDEDRVLKLLRENGGRMKQVDIVEETGWSKSKVSMLLSDMEEDDQISKLRVGRENIVSLVGHEPDAAGSPHED